ncbi:type II toxin-antitoxin system prevent-host-death family antitoxin [Terriglobus sp. RCC_193]|uniref:type II toxin-antitoxin system Phd/YefM family antitoxin n=1 Tax=Terriglobus sp. RCC_193 TaxID=3239218 RepID=UPI003524E4B7
MATWGLAEAKAKFSEVVERAERHEPQEITRNGKPVAVIVSREEWEARKAMPPIRPAKGMSAWDAMRPSKLGRAGDFTAERDRTSARAAKF